MNEKPVEKAIYRTDGIIDYWQKQRDELRQQSFEATLRGDTNTALKSATLAQYFSEQIEAAEDFLSRDN